MESISIVSVLICSRKAWYSHLQQQQQHQPRKKKNVKAEGVWDGRLLPAVRWTERGSEGNWRDAELVRMEQIFKNNDLEQD